jgi:hypothetical protein
MRTLFHSIKTMAGTSSRAGFHRMPASAVWDRKQKARINAIPARWGLIRLARIGCMDHNISARVRRDAKPPDRSAGIAAIQSLK